MTFLASLAGIRRHPRCSQSIQDDGGVITAVVERVFISSRQSMGAVPLAYTEYNLVYMLEQL
jgi:hypothetical protein